MRKVLIAGGACSKFIGKFHPDFIWKKHPDFGKKENPDLGWYVREVGLDALVQSGATAAVVDKAYVGNFVGELFDSQGHLGAMLAAADPDLAGKPIARMEGACASGGLALAAGVDAIRGGADVVLVVGAEVQTTVNAKIGADYLARAAHYKRQREIDEFTFPCLFAKRAKAVTAETETTLEDCARAAVKAYANANRNPLAHMHTVKMTLEQAATASDKNPAFLANPEFKDFLRVSDCSQVSDGGSALVLCSEEGLSRLGRAAAECSEIVSCVVSTASLAEDPVPVRLENTARAARQAYAAAGIKPDQIQLAEVHDCFTVTEILMYEALGWAEQGQGARLLRGGQTEVDGRIPVNTGGGLVGFGHPVGATGVKQVLELHRQLKGQCGDYQVKNSPNWALAANMGGDDRTSVVTICRNVG
jgi:acetyl-CoA acyltransferase